MTWAAGSIQITPGLRLIFLLRVARASFGSRRHETKLRKPRGRSPCVSSPTRRKPIEDGAGPRLAAIAAALVGIFALSVPAAADTRYDDVAIS